MNRDLVIVAKTVVLRGQLYKKGDTAERIPQNDGQPLVDIGAARWAGTEAVPSEPKPRIWRLSVKAAQAAVSGEDNTERLRRWRKEEQRNPKYPGGREGVLSAIAKRIGEE